MRITEVIKELETMLQDVGDVIVEVRNREGDFGYSSVVEMTHYGKPGQLKWCVTIDV